MLEVYVALTLLGIGVMLNKNTPKKIPAKRNIVPVGQTPSMTNVYNSVMKDTVQQQEANQVKKHNEKLVSQLAGMEVDKIHGNMFPFLRGSVKQNVDGLANVGLMEAFGTKNDTTFRKQEIGGMFVPEPNIKPFSLANIDDLTSRVAKPVAQKNVLPFKQERVGRGIDAGYGTAPSGGFHQLDIVDKIRPKTVDELRVASKPKFGGVEGRILEGQKGSNRGQVGVMEKHRPDTAFELSHDRLVKSAGVVKKEKAAENVMARDTSRMVTSAVGYAGGAYDARKGHEQRAAAKAPSRQVLGSIQAANVRGARTANDYGKGAVQIRNNGRDITTTRTHKGNVQSLIKSIIAPIQDIIRVTRKEHFIDPTREFGQMSVQIPSKLTVHDPNDVARTTIRETTIHDSESLNLKGPVKLTVYDPADIARTTARQTMLQSAETMNMSAHVYKSTVYDPNNVARTTVKETLLQSADPANLRKIEERGAVYASDKTRATVRQTLDLPETNVNLSSVQVHKGTVYDPTDVSRVTIRQTTQVEDHIGVASGITQNAAYIEAQDAMMVKGTQQASYNDNDYYGTAQAGDGGGGYEEANFEAKVTMKQDPQEYFGVAADQTVVAPRMQDDVAAVTFKDMKTLVERDPTVVGVKTALSAAEIGGTVDIKRTASVGGAPPALPSTMSRNAPREINFTKNRQITEGGDRLDLEILEPFKRNPFTQSLNSFA